MFHLWLLFYPENQFRSGYPDLAPMDFAVFPYIKSFLRGMRFDNLSELRQAVLNVIFHMKTDQFVQIFDDWVRHKKCVELKGDYVEKS
jgi:hypothetical protein